MAQSRPARRQSALKLVAQTLSWGSTKHKGLRPKMAGPGYGVGFVQQASFVYSLYMQSKGAGLKGVTVGGRQSMGTTCMQLLLHLPLGYSCVRAT